MKKHRAAGKKTDSLSTIELIFENYPFSSKKIMIQYIVLFQTESTAYCGVKRDSWPTMMTQRYLLYTERGA